MGFKKYSDAASAERMIEKIIDGEIASDGTAYRELQTIASEWKGTYIGDRAQYLIDNYYADWK
ncbi:hypothetical protein [Pseudobutyrivibrio xylanivorans]|uniref:Uncharacterized protein n=1 Tax=Pseudobutyrivibrio xylanivorans TaxID=185007 RepID=A0A5P6VQN9_PSEXY|nr:hypothetical protein [Pseudobutyrivibrio xylanivorans]QFJ54800.1 hypothetical protein FXF36_08015 [Pseudobutyrivibrio xylanivorans]